MNERIANTVSKVCEKYSEILTFRAAVQVIPWVGGSLDTLFCGKASKIAQNRINDFLAQLHKRLQYIENAHQVEPTEEFFDLMISAFDSVLRTRSESKRKYLAALVANQVQFSRVYDEAETALQIISELSDIHIRVLLSALKAPICNGSFSGLKVVTIKDTGSTKQESGQPTHLIDELSDCSSPAIRLLCSQLVARGLFHDEGIGRVGTKAMEYFVPTETAEWLIKWIEISDQANDPPKHSGSNRAKNV